jgi:hypothetical protein
MKQLRTVRAWTRMDPIDVARRTALLAIWHRPALVVVAAYEVSLAIACTSTVASNGCQCRGCGVLSPRRINET